MIGSQRRRAAVNSWSLANDFNTSQSFRCCRNSCRAPGAAHSTEHNCTLHGLAELKDEHPAVREARQHDARVARRHRDALDARAALDASLQRVLVVVAVEEAVVPERPVVRRRDEVSLGDEYVVNSARVVLKRVHEIKF